VATLHMCSTLPCDTRMLAPQHTSRRVLLLKYMSHLAILNYYLNVKPYRLRSKIQFIREIFQEVPAAYAFFLGDFNFKCAVRCKGMFMTRIPRGSWLSACRRMCGSCCRRVWMSGRALAPK